METFAILLSLCLPPIEIDLSKFLWHQPQTSSMNTTNRQYHCVFVWVDHCDYLFDKNILYSIQLIYYMYNFIFLSQREVPERRFDAFCLYMHSMHIILLQQSHINNYVMPINQFFHSTHAFSPISGNLMMIRGFFVMNVCVPTIKHK